MPIGWALGIDVLTAILGIVPLLLFAIPQPERGAGGQTSLWAEFREGIETIWHNPALRQLYALLTLAVLIVMPLLTLIPLLVKVNFAGGAKQVAMIESIGGIGMIIGGIAIAILAPRQRTRWVLWGFGLSCFSFALTALPSSGYFWIAILFWSLGACAYAAGNAPFMAIVQSTVPNQLHGRVLALLTTLMALAAPVGLAVATPLGELIGVRWLFVLLGLLGGTVMLLGLLSPTIQHADA